MSRSSSPHATLRAARAWLPALVLGALVGGGCAFGEWRLTDPLDRKWTLENAQHKYTELIRWSEFTKASAFVSDDRRDSFLDDAPSLESLRFTDYEVGRLDIDPDTGESIVEVTYTAYSPRSPLEISITETQHWSRSNITNDWRVRPVFTGLEQIVR